MKKPKLKYSEQQLQHAIIERLAWIKNVYYIRNNSVAGKLIRSDGSSGWINNAKKGAPDIILCKNGLWIGIEVKTEIGKQSPEQKLAEQQIRKCGGLYFIVRSLEDVDKILDCF